MYDYKAEKSNKNLPVSCRANIHPQQSRTEFNRIVFDSTFDSGNLERVERNRSSNLNHFNLWVCNDCKGTQSATNYRTWFYFSVTGVDPNSTLTLTIMNLNFQRKLFNEGMVPVFKSSITNQWLRVSTNVTTSVMDTDNGLEVTWTHPFVSEEEKVWFAFSFPFSCEENDNMMKQYEEIFRNDADVYFHRCALTKSKENRDVELVTISSQSNRTTAFEKFAGESPPQIFKNKKYVFVSARVHPGETPSSHVFNGFFRMILQKDDLRAQILRENFVFYCVAIINPDGVYRGHYRSDSSGQNLNRFYRNPSATEHPAVFAIKDLIMQLSETKRLHCYVDLHAHATKKGCFIYGNCVDLREQVETCLFPRLLSLNSPYFEYESCNFTEKNMYSKDRGEGLSKEGAGRVALYKATKLNLCYTLECNYNGGTFTNQEFGFSQDSSLNMENQLDSEIVLNGVELAPKKAVTLYTREIFEQLGESLGDSLLDFSSIHPYSRLPNTPFKNLETLRMRMAVNLLKMVPFRFGQYLRKMLRFVSISDTQERALECLKIYLNTGIKNDVQDTTKPLLVNEKTKQLPMLNPLKRQSTITKKPLLLNERPPQQMVKRVNPQILKSQTLMIPEQPVLIEEQFGGQTVAQEYFSGAMSTKAGGGVQEVINIVQEQKIEGKNDNQSPINNEIAQNMLIEVQKRNEGSRSASRNIQRTKKKQKGDDQMGTSGSSKEFKVATVSCLPSVQLNQVKIGENCELFKDTKNQKFSRKFSKRIAYPMILQQRINPIQVSNEPFDQINSNNVSRPVLAPRELSNKRKEQSTDNRIIMKLENTKNPSGITLSYQQQNLIKQSRIIINTLQQKQKPQIENEEVQQIQRHLSLKHSSAQIHRSTGKPESRGFNGKKKRSEK